MSNPNDVPVVRCADEYIRLFYTKVWKQSLVVFVVMGPLLLLARLSGQDWLGVVLILGFGLLFVLPRIRRESRFLNHLPCAHCGQEAGSHFSEKSIIHLRCQHCEKTSRTDCMNVGIPSKI